MTDQPEIREIKPGVRIRDKEISIQERLGINVREAIGEDQINAAQQHINALKDQFPDEAKAEIMHLQKALRTFVTPIDKENESFSSFQRRTLDLKSTAGMFGYPLITLIANSLFNFCQNNACSSKKSVEIIRIHVAALHRILEDNIGDEKNPVAQEIVKQLRIATE